RAFPLRRAMAVLLTPTRQRGGISLLLAPRVHCFSSQLARSGRDRSCPRLATDKTAGYGRAADEYARSVRIPALRRPRLGAASSHTKDRRRPARSNTRPVAAAAGPAPRNARH